MHGGTISDNFLPGAAQGGGVFNFGTGVFTMYDGEIYGNRAGTGGGVNSMPGTTFNMRGGTIADNTAGTNGGGVIVAGTGSGVNAIIGTFNMYTGATISGNTAGNGGGVVVSAVSAHFNMNGGTIHNNNASNGGGVSITSGRFRMQGGVISGNRATAATGTGGGISSSSHGFIQISNGVIYGSEASENLRNTAFNDSALHLAMGHNVDNIQYGSFNPAGDFVPTAILHPGNLTIRVEDELLIAPNVPATGLIAQLSWLGQFGESNTTHTFRLNGNVDLHPHTLPPNRTNLTVILEGETPSNINLASNGVLFTISPGVTLELGNNITLVGRRVGGNGNANNNSHLIRINGTNLQNQAIAPGVLIMRAGSRIIDNTNTDAAGTGAFGGAGVRVNNNGHFIMYGGEISGHLTTNETLTIAAPGNGGGVRVESGGRFDMLGGSIFGNTSQRGGGVLVQGTLGATPAGVFRISGGTIYGNEETINTAQRNTARSFGMALCNLGITLRGTFDAEGAFTEMGLLDISDLTIQVTNGILTVPTMGTGLAEELAWLRMFATSGSTHTITLNGNTAVGPQSLPSGRTGLTINIVGSEPSTVNLNTNGTLFTVNDGVTLVLGDNVTLMGRGPNAIPVSPNNLFQMVRINAGGTLIMNEGSVITGNTNGTSDAVDSGGGVRVARDGVFIMDGGVISRNATTNIGAAIFSPGHGGGVRVEGGGRFDMLSGTISGNAAQAGGGVWVSPENLLAPVAPPGLFRISNGTIFGNEIAVVADRNTARGAGFNGGAALSTGNVSGATLPGTALRGTFSAGVFTQLGEPFGLITDTTIRIANGELD
jgi:hypothetical protein